MAEPSPPNQSNVHTDALLSNPTNLATHARRPVPEYTVQRLASPVSGSVVTAAMNNSGEVAGGLCSRRCQAFTFSKGRFTTLPQPDRLAQSFAAGIGASGQVVVEAWDRGPRSAPAAPQAFVTSPQRQGTGTIWRKLWPTPGYQLVAVTGMAPNGSISLNERQMARPFRLRAGIWMLHGPRGFGRDAVLLGTPGGTSRAEAIWSWRARTYLAGTIGASSGQPATILWTVSKGRARYTAWSVGFDPQLIGGSGRFIYVAGYVGDDFDLVQPVTARVQSPLGRLPRIGPTSGLPWPGFGPFAASIGGITSDGGGRRVVVGAGAGAQAEALLARAGRSIVLNRLLPDAPRMRSTLAVNACGQIVAVDGFGRAYLLRPIRSAC